MKPNETKPTPIEESSGLLLTARGVVRPLHCDHMGHMNVMWYTARFDEATWHLFHEIEITPSYMRENQRGMAGVQQDTTYKQELFAGDVITVWSRILEIREKVIRFHHEMRNDESQAVAATTTLTAVHLNRETRKSCPFMKEILERGRLMISADKKP
ncbi:MAG: thioesterase family protein [Candidatus Sulfotelmatobacter sp.]